MDAGLALAIVAAAASGSLAGIVAIGDRTRVVAAPIPVDTDAQAYVAPSRPASPVLTASDYGATTVAEVRALHRAMEAAAELERLKAIRAAVAAGEPYSVDDLPRAGDPMVAAMGWTWPVAMGTITDTFGTRGGAHAGIDIAAAEGTPARAAAPGIVVASEESAPGYGVMVVIEHADGVRTLYAHLVSGSRAVRVGDWVEPGEIVGAVGNTGRSFGPHLHFEVRVAGAAVDPFGYLPGAGAPPA
ncbi:M23 family metallopeptidase [Microbacterium sp. Marseille-Q6965]|uniref:M23 family metallopeptidase n=1 Tax=Microbacterium sp. Marseille-Q6965 TaxID=2965072 RepID=UPI0021B7C73E|nr:M23 family metallopeptidase [Microbacterium sp. Marseille-Q6965]